MLTKKFFLFFMLITFIYLPFLQAKYFVQSTLGQSDYTEQMGLRTDSLYDSLYINEFMADNVTTIADENGEYDDWVEIYNAYSGSVSMYGLFLTDNPEIPNKWQFPDVHILPDSFLLVWADDDEEQGPLHTNFKLSADGEFIGLYEMDGITPIDTLSFGPQVEDISFGRYPDGGSNWGQMNPTPGSTNNPILSSEDFIFNSPLLDATNYPNPFNPTTTISYQLSADNKVSLSIYNIKGQKVKTLVNDIKPAGEYSAIWNGRDSNGNRVSSGIYFYRLHTESYSEVKKMLLVK